MKSRVNIKFVIILGAVIVGLAGGMLLFANFFLRKSSAELEQMANVYLAEGNYVRGYDNLTKARHKSPNDADLAIRTAEVGLQAPVSTARAAQQRLSEINGFYAQASKVEPRNQSILDQYLGSMLRLHEELGFSSRGVLEQAQAKLANDPDNLTARKYRGIARTALMAADTAEADRLEASGDLQAYLAEHPGDPVALRYLQRWRLREAEILATQNRDPERVTQLRNDAVKAARDAVEAEPKSPERLIDLAVALQSTRSGDAAELADIANRAEAAMLANLEADTTLLQTVYLLLATDRTPGSPSKEFPRTPTSGQLRAVVLLEKAAEAFPSDLRFAQTAAVFRRDLGDAAGALRGFDQVRRDDQPQPTITYIRNDNIRSRASFEAADLYLLQADQATGKERDSTIQQADAIYEEQRVVTADDGLTNLLGGKIARLRGDEQLAQKLLTRAADQLGDQSAVALYLSAEIYNNQGEWGTARAQLERLMRVQPAHVPGRVLLTQVLLKAKQPDQAAAVLDPLVRALPDNAQVIMLQAAVELARDKTDTAIAMLRRLDLFTNERALATLVQAYLQTDRRDQALAELQEMQKKDPGNLAVVQILGRLTESPEVRNDIMNQAEAAGANQTAIDLVREMLDPDNPMDASAIAEKRIDAETDPAVKALLQATYHRQRGEADAYREALGRADKIEPVDEDKRDAYRRALIDMQFNDALAAKDLDAARTLARRAGEAEMDGAGGAFYVGRVEATGGNVDAAIGHLRGGLQQRPVYSEGHRMLGALLMERGDSEAAREQFQLAVDQKPDNVGALVGLGVLAERANDRAEALRRFRDAMSVSNAPAVWQQYLMREQAYGDPQRALDARKKLAKANPGDVDNRRDLAVLLARTGKRDEAIEVLNNLVQEHGASRDMAGTRADVELAAGDPAAASGVIRDYVASRGDAAEWPDLLMLGRAERASGNGEAAVAAYQRAIAADDSPDMQATREFAAVLVTTNNYEPALEHLRRLHTNLPNDTGITLDLAELLLRLRQIQEVNPVLASTTFTDPDDQTRAEVIRALALRQDKQDEKAQAVLEGAVATHPTPAALLQLASLRVDRGNQLEQAQADLNQALEMDPGDNAARQLLAEVLRRRGDLRNAEAQLERLVREQPGNAAARLQLVDLYERRNNTVAAAATLRDAAERMPQVPLWPDRLAGLLEKQGRHRDAAPLRQRVLELAPSVETLRAAAYTLISADRGRDALNLLNAQASLVEGSTILQAMRARALLASGARDAAIQAYNDAVAGADSFAGVQVASDLLGEAVGPGETLPLLLATQPRQPAWREIAAARFEISTGNPAAAVDRLRPLQEAVKVDPATYGVYRQTLALALQQSKQFAEARAVYESLIADTQQNMVTLNNLAYLLSEDLGQHAEAMPLAEQAAQLAPRDELVLDTLGWIQHRAGQNQKALETLKRSVEQRAVSVNTYHLGVVYDDAGQPDLAREMLTQAVRLAETEGDADLLAQAQQRLAKLSATRE